MNDTPRYARLHWDESGLPVSTTFDDVYFSKASGLEETLHNFITQNNLLARWQALPAQGYFCIGETGFGTGLNFLCAWQLFEQHAPASARLHFISVEKYPLSAADLARACALWPSLANQAQQLLAQYRVLQPGVQHFSLAGGRVALTLLLGDALQALPELSAQVHAWFLDGFAPAKNPDMWAPQLFSELARLSAPGATLGTFTAAGVVRRGLLAEGFEMLRVPGYGHKREVMRGVYRGLPAPPGNRWYARPTTHTGARHAIVVGAGLAGCASAASLAARGWQVTVLEREGAVAQGASGNHQGVLYLKLSAHGTALSQLVLSGFGYTRRLLQALPLGEGWAPCGVLQLAFDEREASRQAALATAFDRELLYPVNTAAASALAGTAVPCGGLYFPDAGWAHPPSLCAQLLQHPAITVRTHHDVLSLHYSGEQWQALSGPTCLAEAPVVVLANAEQARHLAEVPLKPIRGQVTHLPATPASAALRTVVCAEGYLAPARAGEHTLGASFDFNRQDRVPSVAEHLQNMNRLQQLAPALAAAWPGPPGHLDGRVALRCTTPDYLPLVGPLANEHGAYTGLYLNTGHGSRGLVTAPLAGELLAAWVDGEALPVATAVAHACHPNRFTARAARRAGAQGL